MVENCIADISGRQRVTVMFDVYPTNRGHSPYEFIRIQTYILSVYVFLKMPYKRDTLFSRKSPLILNNSLSFVVFIIDFVKYPCRAKLLYVYQISSNVLLN